MSLYDLECEAERACEFRGHTLGKWNVYHGEFRTLSNNECVHCGKWVQCNTNPIANQIDIGGNALAENCTKGEK